MSFLRLLNPTGMLRGRPRQAEASPASLGHVDRLLREQASDQRVSPPPDLQVRIIESIRELNRAENHRFPPMATAWRPILGIAAAAGIAGVITIGIYSSIPPAAPGPAVTEEARPVVEAERPRPLTIDPGPAVIPAGRMVISRVESPLLMEAELLRRDTQRATEIVLSHLPFGGGFR